MTNAKLAERIEVLVNQKEAEVINIRRDIHMHPEISGKEERTSGIVAEYLKKQGIMVQRCQNSFGVIGRLIGSKPGPVIALRADMDALPLQEKTGLPYASKIDGQMHACGHDVHTAILMGTAAVLSAIRDKLNGSAIFLFQPSEEFFPGGALGLIEEGGIDNPRPDAIFALHTSPIPVGKIAISPGPVMGSVSSLSLRIFGRGGHFAAPHLAVDPILVSSNVVVALSSMVPRRVNPMEDAVLTFGMIEGGTRDNIIGDMVVLRGNIGSLNESLCVKLMEDLEKTVKGITEGMGATYKLKYIHGYPTVRNDPQQVIYVRNVASHVIGESNVIPCTPSLGGEDMSYFLQKIPGALFLLGVHDTESDQPPVNLHDPAFAPDERAIAVGMKLMSRLVTDAAD